MFSNRRRKQIVVDKSYQYRTAFGGLIYVLGVAAIVAVPLFKMMGTIELLLIGQEPELRSAYEALRFQTLAQLIIFLTLITSIYVLGMLVRTHKVAGPIVKMTRHIHDIAAGKFNGPIRLRSGDELQALAAALNRMIDGLRERDRTIRDGILTRIAAAQSEIERTASPQSTVKTLEKLADSVKGAYEPAEDAGAELENLMRS